MSSDGSIPANVSKGAGTQAIDQALNYQENGVYVRRPAIRAALANQQNK